LKYYGDRRRSLRKAARIIEIEGMVAMGFKDKVVIISGGAAGMGKAAALAFAREGAIVIVNDMDETALAKTINEIHAIGGMAKAAQGDVTKSNIVRSIVNGTIEQYGKIDILFNYVGGIPDNKPLTAFTEETEEYWDRMIDINLKSTILLSRAVLDTMIQKKYGKIINTGAIAGRIGGPKMVVYSAVKGGVIAFTKALALEVAPYNINVNCVSPGPIETPGSKKIFTNEGRAEAMAITLFKRFGQPEDVANAVLYLASDDASFITGQTLAVDGGATRV
jgi:NAD(P)-dependent dehydrogenase (short-subunit alcohol dehydrogenase family)